MLNELFEQIEAEKNAVINKKSEILQNLYRAKPQEAEALAEKFKYDLENDQIINVSAVGAFSEAFYPISERFAGTLMKSAAAPHLLYSKKEKTLLIYSKKE